MRNKGMEDGVSDPSQLYGDSGSNPAQTYEDVSVQSVVLSCALNAFLLLGCLAAMEGLLRWEPGRAMLAPRLASSLVGRVPFGWVRQVWEEWRRPWALDPDGAAIVRFCELGFKFSACGSLLCILLMPLYASGHAEAQGLNRLSISNLRRNSDRFWGAVVGAYLLTGIFSKFVLEEWREFLTLRRQHFRSVARGNAGLVRAQVTRSIMVESLPPSHRTEDDVKGFFQALFGAESVHSCAMETTGSSSVVAAPLPTAVSEQMASQQPDLQQPMLRDEGAAAAAEDALPARGSPIQAAGGILAGAAREGQQALQGATTGAIRAFQDVALGRSTMSTAFVTLRSAARCVEAQQVVTSHEGFWKIQQAPEPQGLIWANAQIPLSQILVRNSIAKGICAAGLLFWSVPVSLIQAVVNVGELEKWVPWFAHLAEVTPWFYSLLTSYLPVLALIGLQALLPLVFEAMAVKYEGHKAKADVQRIVLNRCFGYQLASLYVTVVSASLWDSLKKILDRPQSILEILSSSLPKVATYFVTYVLARAGGGLPLLLLQPGSLIEWLRRRELPRLPARCEFGSEAANAALVLTIGLTYSYIAPAILPACAAYFALATVTYRWLFTHVFEQEFDGGGDFWFDLFNSVLLGLLLGTLSLVAMAALRANYAQFAVLVPLPIGVLWLGFHCWSQFGAASKWVPLDEAVAADEDESAPVEFSASLYRAHAPCGSSGACGQASS